MLQRAKRSLGLEKGLAQKPRHCESIHQIQGWLGSAQPAQPATQPAAQPTAWQATRLAEELAAHLIFKGLAMVGPEAKPKMTPDANPGCCTSEIFTDSAECC